MRSWQILVRKHIIHAVERVFVEDACTPVVCLETLGSVRFAKQIERG